MNARQGQNFTFESVKSAIGGAFVGGLLLPLLLGGLLQLTTGWRLPLNSWPPLADGRYLKRAMVPEQP